MERYAGQQPRASRTVVRAPLDSLTAPALAPRPVHGYPDEVYARHPFLLAPFRGDQETDWVWGYSFARSAPVLVPKALAYYGPQSPGEQFVIGSSSGCATGSCLEEAALYGLLELIERDAFLLAWHTAAHLPEILPDSCATPETADTVDRMRALGYEIRLFDLRADLPFPVVLCTAVRREPGPGNLCMSAGAALDPEEAALTAVREVATYLPGFGARVRRQEQRLRAIAADYDKLVDLPQHALLYGLPEMADRVPAPFTAPREHAGTLAEAFEDWQRLRPRHTDLRDLLLFTVDAVRALGDDVVVVEQTCPEQSVIGVRTAAVIAPGLVPIDFGWERQRVLHSERLRTVRHRAARTDGPVRADAVHRHPHPFM
ncbi:YcaO-like family protein [Streptomyces sp. NPDC088817]|uniref:YcaO-like family protein n=1 Tax=unclassified Streptomyces TaxID=2593676 RepID=UPI00381F02E1